MKTLVNLMLVAMGVVLCLVGQPIQGMLVASTQASDFIDDEE